MCYFIVMGIPEKIAESAVATLPGGLRAILDQTYGGLDRLISGCSLYLIVDGFCSCSLFVPEPTIPDRQRVKKKRRSYEKRGWSESKIQRALADISRAPAGDVGLNQALANWVAATAETGGSVFIYVHWAPDKIPRTLPLIHLTSTRLREDRSLIRANELTIITYVSHRSPKRTVPPLDYQT